MIHLRRILPLMVVAAGLLALMMPGCDKLITEVNEFTIAGHPTAEFELDVDSTNCLDSGYYCQGDSGCAPLAVRFLDMSNGPHDEWIWNFGDGTVDTVDSADTAGINPIHVYREEGTYAVSLSILDHSVDEEPGADTEVKKRFIIVGTTIDSFKAAPDSGCTGLEVTFAPIDYGGISSFAWRFGDGSAVNSDSNPTHIYDSAGVYSCTLTVTGECGSKTIAYDSLIKVIECPEVRIWSDLRVICKGDTVQFVDSTDYSTLGEPTYRTWNFGESDEDTSSAATPMKVYSDPGKYTVKLTVTTGDSAGGYVTAVDSIQDYIIVYGGSTASPGAASATQGCVDDLYAFQVKFRADNMNAVDSFHYTKLVWDFGDGTPPTDPNVDPLPLSPVHTYQQPGEYDVTLIAWTYCADSVPATAVGFVKVAGPLFDDSVWFTIDSSYFENVDTIVDITVDTTVDTIVDSTVVPPDSTFDSLFDSLFDSTFNITDTTLTFVFQDSSQGWIESWEWDFGDASTGLGDTVEHIYEVFDTLDVTLRVINDCDSAMVTRTIIVEEPPSGASRRRYSIPDGF